MVVGSLQLVHSEDLLAELSTSRNAQSNQYLGINPNL